MRFAEGEVLNLKIQSIFMFSMICQLFNRKNCGRLYYYSWTFYDVEPNYSYEDESCSRNKTKSFANSKCSDNWTEKYFKSIANAEEIMCNATTGQSTLKSYHSLLRIIEIERKLGLCHTLSFKYSHFIWWNIFCLLYFLGLSSDDIVFVRNNIHEDLNEYPNYLSSWRRHGWRCHCYTHWNWRSCGIKWWSSIQWSFQWKFFFWVKLINLFSINCFFYFKQIDLSK